MSQVMPAQPDLAPGRGASWADRFSAWREALTARPGFRAWAARFPLTRPLARRRARALFDLCAGFVYSQVLAACVRLRLFEVLHAAPASASSLAAQTGLSPDAMQRLLVAAEALELVRRRADGQWALGPLGAAMIGNPGIAAMVEHHAMLYTDLADPVALLKRERGGTALANYWAYAGAAQPDSLPGTRVSDYTALMAASQPMVAQEVLAAYRFGRHRHLMDVGGGSGAFLAAVGQSAPGLALTLFDLPAVAEQGRARFERAGMAGRARVTGGDFSADSLPLGADIISLVRVLHDHDDDVVRALLGRVRAALPPGGRVLIAEPMAGTPGAEPMGGAYFGFYLLAMGRGRPRRPEELAEMLRSAGFGPARLLPTDTPLLTRVMVADVSP